jgi:galactokinase
MTGMIRFPSKYNSIHNKKVLKKLGHQKGSHWGKVPLSSYDTSKSHLGETKKYELVGPEDLVAQSSKMSMDIASIVVSTKRVREHTLVVLL